MLERIHQIKGIGLLHDANGRALGLKRASLIYADNGGGKSTLASIFRSCSLNDPALILNRRTIDGVNVPEVNLQFSNGHQSAFQNGTWNQARPELLVFDADFVEKNVYAGGQVTSDQRKNLLQFALGETAVTAQREYESADNSAKKATTSARENKDKLDVIHKGMSLSQFQALPKVPDADHCISVLREQIVQAKNIGVIQAKALPKQLVTPHLDVEQFFKILTTSFSNIDLEAEAQVKFHLKEHNKSNLEKWVSDGYAYGEEGTCLFCNQPLDGVNLIKAYRSYFNKDYNELKSSVAELGNLLSSICSDRIVSELKASFSTASAVIDGWQEHLDIPPPIFDEAEVRQAIHDIRSILDSLKQRKEERILEEIGSEENKDEIKEKWDIVLSAIQSCNQSISNAFQLIATYKEKLATVSIEDLQQQICDLEWSKTRHRQDVLDLLNLLTQAQALDASAKIEKQSKKDALNQIMQTTLDSYKERINQLLRSFGAQFTIPNIDFNYRGGLRSDYVLQMRGANIALNGGVPDFKTSLSEGDKRTLAFAFFIASAESDTDLDNKIIVIDDPMCSLDLNRKQQTRTVLKRLHDSCKQLIVLAHDAHFLRSFQQDILRTGQPQDIKVLRLKSVANRYSNFDDIDIDQECESAYFRCHRILGDYMAGNATSSMEVARSIRPMLEGYLHRRFPGLVNRGLLFGEVVNVINTSQPPSPLIHAKKITDELNEINRYAGQFHHDTNPAADQIEIVDGELLGFVERAINVVHTGES